MIRLSFLRFVAIAAIILLAGSMMFSQLPAQQPQPEAPSAPNGKADQPESKGFSSSHKFRFDSSQRSKDLIALTVVYCLLIVGGSMCGGWLPSVVRLTHARIEMMMSLVGGLMLGIGLLHLLPHAVYELGPGSIDRVAWWVMLGLLTMFLLLRMFHFHQHGAAEELDHGHGHGCGHEHDHDQDHPHADVRQTAVHHLSWMGVFFGLSLHTLIDGLALAASVQVAASHDVYGGLFGLGTFAAILLHKPLDAVSITTLMSAAGWSTAWRNAINIGFAMVCPIGAALFFFGLNRFSGSQAVIVGCSLAFSAGVFLCISLGDLLPEIQFHSHNRIPLTAALLVGVGLAFAIRFLEPAHAHDHGTGETNGNASSTVLRVSP